MVACNCIYQVVITDGISRVFARELPSGVVKHTLVVAVDVNCSWIGHDHWMVGAVLVENA